MVQKVEMCPKSRSDVGKLCGSVIRVIIVIGDVFGLEDTRGPSGDLALQVLSSKGNLQKR